MRKYRLNILELINNNDVVESINLRDALLRHPLCICVNTKCDKNGKYVHYSLEFRADKTQIEEVIAMSSLLSTPSLWEALL